MGSTRRLTLSIDDKVPIRDAKYFRRQARPFEQELFLDRLLDLRSA
jgi:hypothetical protein